MAIKATGDKAKDLARLNELYDEAAELAIDYGDALHLDEEDKEELESPEELLALARKVCRDFDELRRQLPEVKFDMAKGKYFYRFTEAGEEVFAVRVTVKDEFLTYVKAKNESDACAKARLEAAFDTGLPYEDLSVEVVSR